ncbi:UvrD-helicase domain-containing protein [Lachnospiraceae bacterium HCP28S3_F9]
MMEITADTNLDIEKEFKIEAGPGAGKTRFLIHHINNVIKESNRLYSTRKVACITFTNTAVDTIRQRLGDGATGKTEVSTIHSFLYNNIVKPYGSFISNEYGLRIEKIDGHEEPIVNRKYLNKWLEMDILTGLKHPNSQKQLERIPGLNDALRNWLLSAKCVVKKGNIEWDFNNEKAVSYGSEGRISLSRDSFNVLKKGFLEYKKLYWKEGRIDHEDVLFFSGILIQKYPFILTVLRAKYPYFFVDEFQDTNPMQSYILSEIKKKESIVGVIGDSAQAIYGFQGADIQLFKKYKIKKGNGYSINENHRSDKCIVDFLNILRRNFTQIPCERYVGASISFYVGDRSEAFQTAKDICGVEKLVSLSRDNVTSNAMKNNLESNNYNKKAIKELEEADSNDVRRNYVIAYVNAIGLARNGKFKEALKKIEGIYRGQAEPQKVSLDMLSAMLKRYSEYANDTLMQFYSLLKGKEKDVTLANLRTGSIKTFYENTPYIDVALGVNIVEDTSNHITIHKAKGAEYDNVFVVGNKEFLDFLLNPNIEENEEHRVYYVALSRAKKRLFLYLDNLKSSDEKIIRDNYGIKVERICSNNKNAHSPE